MPTRRSAAVVLLLALAGAGLVGCGSDEPASSSGTTGHSSADVAFASDMIAHHEQALLMVDMTEGRDLSPELAELTQDIKAAQAPEIEEMTGWLEKWGEKVPDDGHPMGGMASGSTDSDMMGDDDLAELDGAAPDRFEAMWLRMMIAHHEGAVEMAKTEIEGGQYGAAVALARSIVTSQTAEIAHMRSMLAGS
ncbi:DUF305 domain-containing protein [Nocardioides sp. URHA0020]|uniref:DUF305 domain-containing protein n=1 Tax=Nocardioides sp. URHA0020 TaxID=1380392 RepID=UPI00048EA43C|nr:DUF305 domain-containing protein [Nocardioides sp. URHA0020]